MNSYFKLEFREWLNVFTISYGAKPQLLHNGCEQRLVPKGDLNNLPSGFPL